WPPGRTWDAPPSPCPRRTRRSPAACAPGGSGPRRSCGSAPCAARTSRRSAPAPPTGPSSARGSSTSAPRRRCSPAIRRASSPRRTSTATRPCSCGWTGSLRRTSRRSSWRRGWPGRPSAWRRPTSPDGTPD
ncbi:MAG: YjbR family protein, partial [uncultured Solirubrobacteraceae bacterium]